MLKIVIISLIRSCEAYEGHKENMLLHPQFITDCRKFSTNIIVADEYIKSYKLDYLQSD